MHKHLSLVAAALLAGPFALAQDKSADIDRIFAAITPATPGCAVGAMQRGKLVVNRVYGLRNVEQKIALSPRSTFDIGSTQKQFVAAAVLLLVEDRKLSLSDDIRKYIPALHDYGQKVTLDHLLTHTSGIRDWTGMLPMAEAGTDVLQLILRQRSLNFTPGTEWSYSNSGYVLLKEIVGRVSGMPFAKFARRRIFEPLGMQTSSYVEDITKSKGEFSIGYQKDRATWKQFMRLGNERGGGAIVASVGDLLVWNEALATDRLGKFLTAKLQEPARLANGRELRYARGLMVDPTPGGLLISHSGGAAGFSTWLGRVPQYGLSVAVACNFDPVSATALAGRVADLYLPPMNQQAQPPGPVAAAGADVSSRAGLFFNERTGEPMRLGVGDGSLRVANGPTLVAVAPDRFRPARTDLFFRSQDQFELRFLSPARLEITSMEGEITPYRLAQAWMPTAADLHSVDGRYESAELGSVFEVVPGTNGISLRFESTPEKVLELMPVERDTYMRAMMIVRFHRDANGTVTGYDYGNPLVRGIRFDRLGDRKRTAGTSALPAAASEALRLERMTGEYQLEVGRAITITLEDGQLYGEPQGSEKRPLALVSGTTFSAAGSPATLTFMLGTEGQATALVMRQNDNERTLPRVNQ